MGSSGDVEVARRVNSAVGSVIRIHNVKIEYGVLPVLQEGGIYYFDNPVIRSKVPAVL